MSTSVILRIRILKIIFILFQLIIISQTTKSQSTNIDSIVINSTFQCSEIAFTSQKLISEYYFNSLDSILKIQNLWENNCGKNEVNQRIKMLVEIEKGNSVDKWAFPYFSNLLEDYYLRNSISKQKNKQAIFEKDKSFYNYVPIGDKFDSLTEQLAKKNIYTLNNYTAAYLLCILWSNDIDRFEKTAKKRFYRKTDFGRKIDSLHYTTWLKGVFLSYHIGYWFPQNEMKNTFIQNPEYGFSFGIKKKNNLRFDIDLAMRIMDNSKNIQVNYDDKIQNTKVNYGLSGGLLITKQLNFNYKSGIDLRAKVVLSGLSTKLYKLSSDSANNKIYYSAKCIGFSAGIALRHKLFYHNTLIYFIDYNFCPYNKDATILSKLGNAYLSTGICFQY